jgi:hypothetical protein
VGSRRGVDAVKYRKTSCPYRESNPHRPSCNSLLSRVSRGLVMGRSIVHSLLSVSKRFIILYVHLFVKGQRTRFVKVDDEEGT